MLDATRRFGYPVVDLPTAASSPDAAITFLTACLVRSGRLDPVHADRVRREVLEREALAPTGVLRGIAMPHAMSSVVGEVLGIVGRSAVPMRWPGAEPVLVVCLLVAPAGDRRASIQALGVIARRIRESCRSAPAIAPDHGT